MPIASTQAFEQILMHLSVLRYIFKSKSKRGHYDLNKASENFFRDFLNEVYGWKLANMNGIQSNYPAIDLGDKVCRVCVQVTAENSSTKIKNTIEKFEEKGYYKYFDRLIILIITEKKNYSAEFKTGPDFNFDASTDIIDIDDLLEKIETLDLAKWEELATLLKHEMRPLFALLSEPDSIFATAQQISERPPASCTSFMKHLQFGPSDDSRLEVKSVKKIYKKIAALSKETRSYLALIAFRGKVEDFWNSGDKIGIHPQELNKLARRPDDELRGYFEVLEGEGLASYDEDSLRVQIHAPLDSGADFFVELKSFLKGKEEIDAVLSDADFTRLD
ncbi:SMEK domain-containing protein [Burkholderia multivorans]|nr:SMEK domain-containing protein [Burkholderia multivorans]